MSEDSAVNYALVVHFHQPVGQLERILNRIYEQSYELWLRVFEQHPKIKFTLHFSGYLLEWIVKNHPVFISKLETLFKDEQVEFIGGGYYEPILPLIPDVDKQAQVQLLSRYLAEMFGANPTGFWPAERVWEPGLARSLADAGMKYVLIDDYHLRAAGYPEEQTFHAYQTEDQGRKIVLFPINEPLRYLMLWEPQERSIQYLARARTPERDRLAIYLTDAEKYGEWSDAKQSEEWLHRFLEIVEESPWILPVNLTEYLNRCSPKGLVYIPCASYDKMVEWSRGQFRNFLVRYEESNNMHKKMLYVRAKIEEAATLGSSSMLLAQARRELYAAQCNDAYWHGLFGGVYLPNLRHAIYRHLIRAEVFVEDAIKEKVAGHPALKIVKIDFDYDGRDELLLENPLMNVYIKPDAGGNIFELDYKGHKVHNFADTFTRLPEKYHARWQMQPTTDWYRRTLLRDHLLRKEFTLNGFLNMEPWFDQGDFTLEKFEYETTRDEKNASVKLSRIGHDWHHGAKLQLTKVITLQANSTTLGISYGIRNLSSDTLDLRFAPESTVIPPVTFEYEPTPEESENYAVAISGKKNLRSDISANLATEGTEKVSLLDKQSQLTVEFEWDRQAELWVLPLRAMAQTEKKPTAIYEGTTIMPIFPIRATPGTVHTVNLRIGIT